MFAGVQKPKREKKIGKSQQTTNRFSCRGRFLDEDVTNDRFWYF